ncbi:acylneuraminate cytidylyltransferase family protein [[Clostridium] innocuum]|uniref:acylneuraminate cytidylyltransferase family protein n=1 Tax=Clostridium innocuum TaxID=1522 RepID=UPI001EDCA363|nr:acylneuraminate cytidylyltransferase family protein [[Clostridium] innocuum]MCG4662745.1 acylneuraminate cytidylyltransferase family protein [[Clostridium] innocuum]MCR0332734.1 acylneuraminate cytidylyltransferase family protein [[Clostridium] innocuum]
MIAIIPARGGSKGLPGKNIKKLAGKPLIAYTIEAALHATSIDQVIVSTDSEEIANIAVSYGATVPFMRPNFLATDEASAVDVYLYTVERLKEEADMTVDEFMVLLPTSPLRTEEDIDMACEIFNKKNGITLVSVSEVHSPIEWFLKKDNDGFLKNAGLGDSKTMLNRQKYESYYEPNGAIYILNYEHLKANRSYYAEKTIPYVLDSFKAIDIDTLSDFKLAEAILSIPSEFL